MAEQLSLDLSSNQKIRRLRRARNVHIFKREVRKMHALGIVKDDFLKMVMSKSYMDNYQ